MAWRVLRDVVSSCVEFFGSWVREAVLGRVGGAGGFVLCIVLVMAGGWI